MPVQAWRAKKWKLKAPDAANVQGLLLLGEKKPADLAVAGRIQNLGRVGGDESNIARPQQFSMPIYSFLQQLQFFTS
jgi:hypothetical protein